MKTFTIILLAQFVLVGCAKENKTNSEQKTELIGSENDYSTQVEHAVLIHFNYGQTDLQPLFDLEDELEAEINQKQVGEFDGHEIAIDGSDGFLYMYGPNADKLFDAIEPILSHSWITRGAEITKRYGPPGAETDKKVFRIED